jgi:hypothetical protein
LRLYSASTQGAASSRRLVASGAVTVSPYHRVELPVRLTRLGRRLLRENRPLPLTARLSFRALDGRGWSATRRLRLPR